MADIGLNVFGITGLLALTSLLATLIPARRALQAEFSAFEVKKRVMPVETTEELTHMDNGPSYHGRLSGRSYLGDCNKTAEAGRPAEHGNSKGMPQLTADPEARVADPSRNGRAYK